MSDTNQYRVEIRVPGAAGTIFIHVDNTNAEDACAKAAHRVMFDCKVEAFRENDNHHEKVQELEAKVQMLEALRPHWAKGFSDDSVAAQSAINALNQLWKLLGAQDQTDAVRKLGALLSERKPLTDVAVDMIVTMTARYSDDTQKTYCRRIARNVEQHITGGGK